VTYRETAILWDPAKSAASSKQRVAYVVAHELAHQVMPFPTTTTTTNSNNNSNNDNNIKTTLPKLCQLTPLLFSFLISPSIHNQTQPSNPLTFLFLVLVCFSSSPPSPTNTMGLFQWFGNLTTMAWWDNLWLNEGFATFVGTMAVHELFPEWDMFTQFVTDDWALAMDLDSMRSSHPIQVEVFSADQVSEIFGELSWVVRMIHKLFNQFSFLMNNER
jgi:hypothetical protein